MEKELVRLEDAEIFSRASVDEHGDGESSTIPLNLLAFDGTSRIFVWNTKDQLLHSTELQDDPIRHQLQATRDFQTLKLSTDVTFPVRSLKFNRTGLLLLLAGSRAMMVVNVTSQASIVHRCGMIGGVLFDGRSLRIVHLAWHPYSDTHVSVLSSDGVFRLFNVAGNASEPEQEYHLQVRSRSKVLSRPVSFAFGGEHFWDRFTVFILFSDVSIYALCPVVPFGSLHSATCLKELIVQPSTGDSAPMSKQNASLAAVWLEIVFPEFAKNPVDSAMLRARAQSPFDASLVLQGPLLKLLEEKPPTSSGTGLLYSMVGKDSVLAVSTRNGDLLFYALADEVQPMWNMQSAPRVIQDDLGDLITLGMLVEPSADMRNAHEQVSRATSDDKQVTGPSPPLLLVAAVDLELDDNNASPVGMFSDPLVPERIYCHHSLGLDSIQLQWLPFSDGGQSTKAPNVFSLLETLQTEKSEPVPLLGASVILMSAGDTWLVAFTASGKSAVMEMKPHRYLSPLVIEETAPQQDERLADTSGLRFISHELLRGPKEIYIPKISSTTPLVVETVEGRAVLHEQWKHLHEKYIEYCHRVYVELKNHHKYLGQVVKHLEKQLHSAFDKLERAENDAAGFIKRINRAFEKNKELQERIHLCNLIAASKQKRLTLAERDLKELLDIKMNQEVDILQAAVESLSLRADRVVKMQGVTGKRRNLPRLHVPENQMRVLKQAMDRLGSQIELSGRALQVLNQAVRRKEVYLK